MTQADIFGAQSPAKTAPVVRDTRSSVAEEKAQLALQLGELINRVPMSVCAGSVEVVRQWKKAREAAAKIARSKTSSVPELTAAINNMRRWL